MEKQQGQETISPIEIEVRFLAFVLGTFCYPTFTEGHQAPFPPKFCPQVRQAFFYSNRHRKHKTVNSRLKIVPFQARITLCRLISVLRQLP